MRDLQPVFDHTLAGTARVDVDHRVRRRFRWMVLLELTFALLISICALPVLALVVVLGGGGELPLPDLDDLRQRAWIRYRVLRCTVVDAAGQAQVHSEIEIRDTPHADALMGALFAHCDAARVVLVERLAGGPVTTAWYGGQPLGQAPERLDEAHATRTLDHAGTTLDTTAEGLRLVLPAPRPGRIGSALGMVLLAPSPLGPSPAAPDSWTYGPAHGGCPAPWSSGWTKTACEFVGSAVTRCSWTHGSTARRCAGWGGARCSPTHRH